MTIATKAHRRTSREMGFRAFRAGFSRPHSEGDLPMETSHVSALQLKHAGLERELEQEMSRPMPDLAIVQTLKKRKLRIKEELSHI
jgi:hypothetical protein